MQPNVPVIDLSVDARGRFIVRTYSHLVGAILAFTALEVVFFSTGLAETMTRAMMGSKYAWLIVLGGFVVVSWLATHVAHIAESLPVQYAALGGFVLAESIIFVPLLWIANKVAGGQIIQSAALVTLVGFAGLTAIVFWTRKDFSFLRGILCWGGVVALVLIVTSIFFGWHLGTWFSVGMIALAGGAILYDTSNVLHHYAEDRYVGASLQLFASVALMFWYVLRLFLQREDD